MRERGFDDYAALWQWSVDDLEGFWASIWDFFGVAGSYDRVLASREMPGARWFPGAEVNYAEHLFRGKDDDAVAIVHASELRELSELTWGELRRQTASMIARLRALGVERGDRVAAYMPNIPEATAAFLACAAIGALWSSCSPDFGARSVIDRFAQIEPKVLLAVDGYRYNGRDFDRRETVAGIAAEAGGQVVTLGYLDGSGWPDEPSGDTRLRAPAVRSSAVGPVLVRDDRAAEGDRPGPGRDPARASQEAAPARRRPGRRPAVLVHDHRLDDVELPHLGAAHRGGDRALRRQPGRAGHGRAVGPRRPGGSDHVRHQRGVHRELHEGRRRAGRGARPEQAAGGRVDRLAAVAGRVPLGLRARRQRHLAVLHQRRHRPVHGVRRRLPARPGLRGRAAGPRRSARRSRPGTPTASR